MKTLKKIGAIASGILLLGATLTGCTGVDKDQVIADLTEENTDTQSQLDELNEKFNLLMEDNEVDDIELENLQMQIANLTEQKNKDDQIIADYEDALAEQEAEEQAQADAEAAELKQENLFIGEWLVDYQSTLTESDLSGLYTETVSTGKGTTEFEQYIKFKENGIDSTGQILFGENDDDVVAPYLYFDEEGFSFAYVLEFDGDGLETDLEEDGELSDFDNVIIPLLGQEFAITEATYDEDTERMTLNLFKGVSEISLSEGETEAVNVNGVDYEVTMLFISEEGEVLLSINGETTDTLGEGDTDILADGTVIGVRDVLTNSREGFASIYVGATEIEIVDTVNDGIATQGFEYNNDRVHDGAFEIDINYFGNSVGVSRISYQVFPDGVDGEIYVSEGTSFSDYLDEPEVLLGTNFDISFETLTSTDFNPIKFNPHGDDSYELEVMNVRGEEYDIPFVTIEPGYIKYGDEDNAFHFKEAYLSGPTLMRNPYNIFEDDTILLTEGTDVDDISRVVIYEGIDVDDKKVEFSTEEGTYTVRYTGTEGLDATGDLILGGDTYIFYVGANEALAMDLNADGDVDGDEVPFVAKGGAILNFGGTTISKDSTVLSIVTPGDEFKDNHADEIINIKISNGEEIDIDILSGIEMFDIDNSDDEIGMSDYGVKVVLEDNDNDPNTLVIEYPEKQVFGILNFQI